MFKMWRVVVVIFLAGRLLGQEARGHRDRSRRQWPFQDKEDNRDGHGKSFN